MQSPEAAALAELAPEMIPAAVEAWLAQSLADEPAAEAAELSPEAAAALAAAACIHATGACSAERTYGCEARRAVLMYAKA